MGCKCCLPKMTWALRQATALNSATSIAMRCISSMACVAGRGACSESRVWGCGTGVHVLQQPYSSSRSTPILLAHSLQHSIPVTCNGEHERLEPHVAVSVPTCSCTHKAGGEVQYCYACYSSFGEGGHVPASGTTSKSASWPSLAVMTRQPRGVVPVGHSEVSMYSGSVALALPTRSASSYCERGAATHDGVGGCWG